MYTLSPWLPQQFFDNNGDPLAGGKVFFYQAGTSTKLDTWQDAGGTVPNANPVVLDSSGRANIFFGPYTYDVLICTSTASDPPSGGEILDSKDGVAATTPFTGDTDIQGTAGENGVAGQWVYLSQGDGGKTIGQWYLTDADNAYSSSTAKAIGVAITDPQTGATFTVRIAGRYTESSGLTAGSIYYLSTSSGAISATAPATTAVVRTKIVAIADSTTSYVLKPEPQYASQSLQGIVSLETQDFYGVKTFYGTPKYRANAVIGTGASPGPATPVSGVMYSSTTSVANVGAGEDTLMTYGFGTDWFTTGHAIRVTAWGTTAANANAKQIKLKLGASTLVASTSSVDYNNVDWKIEGIVVATGGAAQENIGQWFAPAAATATLRSILTRSTSAINISGLGTTISCTGEGVADNDIVQRGMIVELMNTN